jgi:RNA-binding protein
MNVVLNKKQIKHLKSLSHDLKVIIWIGQHGLTDNVLDEIHTALEHHELLKLKVRAGDRDMRDEIINAILDKTQSTMIQKIGNVVSVFKQKEKDSAFKLPA